MLELLLYVALATMVLLGGLVWMIKKYYWGPDGKPPQYRYPDEARKDKDGRALPRNPAKN
jgi:hypothetical protein